MNHLKKAVKAVNDLTVKSVLVIVYFAALPLAKILYLLQSMFTKKKPGWKKNEYPSNDSAYFTSPY